MATDNQGPAGAPPASADPLVGSVLDGRYRVIQKLGEGGMGEVYAAEHVHIEKRVALKLLRPEIVTNQEAVARFHQEARSASSIGHENIIRIEDFGTIADGRIYLCMELLDGVPLNELLEGGTLNVDRALDILIQTCHGLSAAHGKGVVHRDMKPENVFVTQDHSGRDIPKLLDFGIAKVSGADGENHLTRTGTIFGTPFYMAPEQALGQAVDHRADIYAMGVIMYEAFTGSLPFVGESFMGILTKHITAEPTPPSEKAKEAGRTLPNGVEAIINRCMVKDPAGRYQVMKDLVVALVETRRQTTGAGMSSYLPVQKTHMGGAFAPGASKPNNPAVPGSTVLAAGAPIATNQGGSAPVPAAPQPSRPYAITPQPVYRDSPDPAYQPPKKKRRGLWLALSLLLLGGGGVAAVMMMSPSGENTTQREVKKTPERLPTNANDTNPAVADPALKPTREPVDPATPPPALEPDKPTTEEITGPDTDDGGDEPTVPQVLEPVMVEVLISSGTVHADVFIDGDSIGEKTPLTIKVPEGEKTQVSLRKSKFKDLDFEVDGTRRKVIKKMVRDRKSGKGKNKPTEPSSDSGLFNTSPDPIEPPPEPVPYCEQPGNKDKIRCLPSDDCRRPANKAKLHCQLE